MNEEWRAVVGFEGQYEVSSFGRVRSLDRFIACNHYDKYAKRYVPTQRRLRGKTLSPGTMASGHQIVILGRGNPVCVHTLVLEAFVGPCPDRHECCHYDDNPANNHLPNLRWGTRADNIADFKRNNGRHSGSHAA